METIVIVTIGINRFGEDGLLLGVGLAQVSNCQLTSHKCGF